MLKRLKKKKKTSILINFFLNFILILYNRVSETGAILVSWREIISKGAKGLGSILQFSEGFCANCLVLLKNL